MFLLIVAAVVVRSCLARLDGWNPESLWSEDLVWGAMIRGDDFWSMLTIPIPAAPGVFAALWGMYRLFDDPEWSLQLVPFACALVGIPVTALVVRNLTRDDGLVVLAAALVALNPLLTHYSIFVHPYPIDFLVTALLLLAATWVRAGGSLHPRRFALVSVMAGMVIFVSVPSVFASFPIVNLSAVAAARSWSRDRRRARLVLLAAAGYNAIALLAYVLLRGRSNARVVADFRAGFIDVSSVGSAWTFLTEQGRALIEASLPSWRQVENWNPETVSWPLPIVGLGLVWLLARRRTRPFGLAAAGFYAAFLVASSLSIYPLGAGRTDIFAFPVAICLFVLGIHAVTAWLPRASLARAVVGLSIAAFALARPVRAEYWPVNAVHLIRYLVAAATPGDGVILSPSGANLTAFYGEWPVVLSETTSRANAVQTEVVRDLTLHLPSRTAPAQLVARFVSDASPPRIWYVAFRTGESVEVLDTLAAHTYVSRAMQETRMGTLYLAVRFP